MMTFYMNEYGAFRLSYAHVHFTRENADIFQAVERGPRIGVWRVRPRSQAAFQHFHCWASYADNLLDKHVERTGVGRAELAAAARGVASSRLLA